MDGELELSSFDGAHGEGFFRRSLFFRQERRLRPSPLFFPRRRRQEARELSSSLPQVLNSPPFLSLTTRSAAYSFFRKRKELAQVFPFFLCKTFHPPPLLCDRVRRKYNPSLWPFPPFFLFFFPRREEVRDLSAGSFFSSEVFFLSTSGG